MTAMRGINAKADIQVNVKIYILLFFSHSSVPPSIHPPAVYPRFDTWEGFNLSSCWGLALWLAGGISRPYLVCTVHVCVALHTTVSVHRGESCVSDKAEPSWPTWALHKLSELWPSEGGPSFCTARARAHPVGCWIGLSLWCYWSWKLLVGGETGGYIFMKGKPHLWGLVKTEFLK